MPRRTWEQFIADWFDAVEQRIAPARHYRRRTLGNRLRLQERMLSVDPPDEDRMGGRSWLGSRLSPNSALESHLDDYREKAEELATTTPIGASYVRGRVTNVVGTGLHPQSRVREDEQVDKDRARQINCQLEEVYRLVAMKADVTGRLPMRLVQRLVQRTLDRTGEAFLVMSDKPIPGKPIPLALEVVGPYRVATPPELDGEADIRLGIRSDADGMPISYFIYKHDPDDSAEDVEAWEEVRAGRVLHIFEPEEPGQLRGWPAAMPVVKTMRNTTDFEEATLIANQVRACFGAFIPVTDPIAQTAAGVSSTASSGAGLEELYPGMIYRYNADVEGAPTFADPGAGGGSDLETYLLGQHRKIAAGLNYPYEMLFKDYGRLNFAATRAALLEGRIDFAAAQQLLVELFLMTWWSRLVFEAVLLGLVDISPREYVKRPESFSRHQWIPQPQDWVDPQKDVGADETSVNAGFKSRTMVSAARGMDEEEVQEQRTREQVADVERELAVSKARADAEKELAEYRKSLGLEPAQNDPETQDGGSDAGDDGDGDEEDTRQDEDQ
jgi:lambda family phage portal protein